MVERVFYSSGWLVPTVTTPTDSPAEVVVMAAGSARRTSATTPRRPPAASREGGAEREQGGDRRADPPLSWSVVDRQCAEIAAAAAVLRQRLVVGRYAGFAAGFDAGLAVCGMLDTLARDRTRSVGTQRLRDDALRVAHHVNVDLGADADPIEGAPSPERRRGRGLGG